MDKKFIYYSDFDTQFRANPVTKDVVKKTNENSIKQSLRLLLMTSFYDRKWHPEIGCNLNEVLFNQLDDYLLFTTGESVKNLIGRYEPRVEVLDVVCKVSDINAYIVEIIITYKILVTDETDTFIYTINRVR